MSCIVRSVNTKNIGVALYWDIHYDTYIKRRVWRTLWLSQAALPYTKRELRRLGVRTLADLDNDPPVPLGAICRLVIAEVEDPGGCREHRIVRWQVLSQGTDTQGGLNDEQG